GDVLDHFWAGYNFGESFFMSQPGLAWKIVAVGDPLYAPAVFRPAPVVVGVTAASSALVTGQKLQCTATVRGGSGDTRVTWRLSPATGSISASGMYTAPATVVGMAVVTVTATSVADPTKSASTTLRILPAATVSPGS